MEKRINFDEIRNNNFKSMLLFFMFMILIAIIGAVAGFFFGNILYGLFLALLFGIIYSLIVWHAGSSMLLTLSNAKPVTKQEYPHLYHSIEGLSLAAGIPVPKAYVIEDKALNAFATGKNPKNSAVVVTTGLMEKLNREELEGVLAHELSHIKNYDIRSMMIAAVMTGVIVLLSDVMLRSFLFGGGRKSEGKNGFLIVLAIVLAILAPLIAQMIKLAISRKREYAADAGAAVLTRYPKGIANALRKISGDSVELKSATNATAHLYISTPFKGKRNFMKNLFSTHPPIEERIKRLEQM
jgi:heat shock protein HtpX